MAEVGQNDLFGLAVNAESRDDEIKNYADKVPAWSEKERLAFEKLALGLFLTGHPIDQYREELQNIVSGDLASSLATIEKSRGKIDIRLAGILVGVRTRQDRNGHTMGFATLDDKTARIDVTIYAEKFEIFKELLTADEVLLVEATAQLNSYSGMLSIVAEKIYTMEQARGSFARCLMFDWDSNRTAEKTQDFVDKLQQTLQPFSGGQCMLVVNYLAASAKASIQLGDTWRVHPTDVLMTRLQSMLTQDNAVRIKYR